VEVIDKYFFTGENYEETTVCSTCTIYVGSVGWQGGQSTPSVNDHCQELAGS
jgi:hypothetical protein